MSDAGVASSRVFDLVPRILAAQARRLGGDAIPIETSLSALAALLVEVNREMSELSRIADKGDPRVLALAAAVHRIADSVAPLLDALEAERAEVED